MKFSHKSQTNWDNEDPDCRHAFRKTSMSVWCVMSRPGITLKLQLCTILISLTVAGNITPVWTPNLCTKMRRPARIRCSKPAVSTAFQAKGFACWSIRKMTSRPLDTECLNWWCSSARCQLQFQVTRICRHSPSRRLRSIWVIKKVGFSRGCSVATPLTESTAHDDHLACQQSLADRNASAKVGSALHLRKLTSIQMILPHAREVEPTEK